MGGLFPQGQGFAAGVQHRGAGQELAGEAFWCRQLGQAFGAAPTGPWSRGSSNLTSPLAVVIILFAQS